MKTSLFCSALLLSAAQAINISETQAEFQVPQGEFPIAPINGYIHFIYCRVYGEDPNYGPCELVDRENRSVPYVPPTYPEGTDPRGDVVEEGDGEQVVEEPE